MAEEFQAAVCSGSWWMSQRTALNRSAGCSSAIADMGHLEHFCPKDLINVNSRSIDESSDGSTMSPDSAFYMMATAFPGSSPTTANDWNQSLLFSEQYGQNTFSTSNFDGSSPPVTTEIKYQQQELKFETSSEDCSTPYGGYSSISSSQSFLQSFLDTNLPSQQSPMYNFQPNFNDFDDIIQSLPSVSTKQEVPGYFKVTDNTPFLNTMTSPLDNNISSLLPSLSYKETQTCDNLTIKPNHHEYEDLGSMTSKKSSSRVQFKRPRLETPSPFPTFKVRNEKLGDRITALQQLVSPFGKTDTASVLHEAIEYIKLLHDQVNILSVPYMDNGATKQSNQIHDHNNVKDAIRHKQDLKSLGLCLVPVSSMFPVGIEINKISGHQVFWASSTRD